MLSLLNLPKEIQTQIYREAIRDEPNKVAKQITANLLQTARTFSDAIQWTPEFQGIKGDAQILKVIQEPGTIPKQVYETDYETLVYYPDGRIMTKVFFELRADSFVHQPLLFTKSLGWPNTNVTKREVVMGLGLHLEKLYNDRRSLNVLPFVYEEELKEVYEKMNWKKIKITKKDEEFDVVVPKWVLYQSFPIYKTFYKEGVEELWSYFENGVMYMFMSHDAHEEWSRGISFSPHRGPLYMKFGDIEYMAHAYLRVLYYA